MRLQILLHPQLRASIPRCAQRDLCSRLVTRFKTTHTRASQKHDQVSLKSKDSGPSSAPSRVAAVRKGQPERLLVYYGGTGRAMFLGVLRVTTILLFGAACLIVAPACHESGYPWYTTPAVIAGGTLPMLFVAYTSAPYVNFIHLALPAFARKTRETAFHYAKDLPPTAILYINTMRFNTIPRQTSVRIGDLIPDHDPIRPVAFRNLCPAPRPWWAGRSPTQFFAAEKSQPGRQSSVFYPELWPHIHRRIMSNTRPSSKV
ncbi:hypothetical protein N7510_007260 [Penicillium lagena]|uniref:uncharacterized protein n=1 Tax=Penicillium lagena TaxID=94218 RepID=UPI0025415F83|nr:uncharacterized protein N7510_007260 [Penicillium lagena]KAJ5610541.1 hypothetical protein N7510_007260 [Penicillium lagena]